MRFEEYRGHDGLGLAELVAAGEVTPAELAELAIARTGAVNPRLNAVVIPTFDRARRRAGQPFAGPFAGVPFLVKDLLQDEAGVPATQGNRALRQRNHVAGATSEIVVRWRAAGVNIVGRTNTPEFGAKGITEPRAWGATANPWDGRRSPGGSSGGSAAAVAAGIVPLAGGNDGGGSLRIPASHCGLFGFKPGRGRTPWGPATGEQLHGLAMGHVLTRSVRDSAAMLDATHGPERASLAHLAPPDRPYLTHAGEDPAPLRVAFSTRSPLDTDVDPEAVTAVREAAALLEALGHTVEEAEPAVDGPGLARDFTTLWFAHLASTVARTKALTGCGDDGFELDTLAMAASGRRVRADGYVDAYERATAATAQLARFLERHDVLLTPTVAHPPPLTGSLATPAAQALALRGLRALRLTAVAARTGEIEKAAVANLRLTPFTLLANLTGTPAMSLPLHVTAAGLPLGVQVIGPVGGEGLLFQLAGQVERARPWFDRVPPERG